MNIEKELKNYNINIAKRDVYIPEKIEQRKEELMHSTTSSLKQEPIFSNERKTSKVEDTVIKWEDDEEIRILKKELVEISKNIIKLNKLLDILDKKERDILKAKYISKANNDDIADEYGYVDTNSISRFVRVTRNKLQRLEDELN